MIANTTTVLILSGTIGVQALNRYVNAKKRKQTRLRLMVFPAPHFALRSAGVSDKPLNNTGVKRCVMTLSRLNSFFAAHDCSGLRIRYVALQGDCTRCSPKVSDAHFRENPIEQVFH